MPYLCHTLDSHAAITVVKEYTPLKMYTHILVAISLKLNTADHNRCQDSFVTNVNVSIIRLRAANLNIKQTKGMLRQYINSELGSAGTLVADTCP